MTTKEIKQEVVVRTEYIAVDGTKFTSKEECEKYEKSARCVILSRLTRLNPEGNSVYDLYDEGSEEDDIEIFDIKTDEDLELLRRYVYLELSEHNGIPKSGEIEILPNATAGHEVIICWWYDHDGCYTIGDGSLEATLDRIRDNYRKCLMTREQIIAEREAAKANGEN